jgi:hypothetical protein
MDGADAFRKAKKECVDGHLKRGWLSTLRHTSLSLKFMEYGEPEPVDYSTMSDEELMERAIAAGVLSDE